jgi:hypothetical protein
VGVSTGVGVASGVAVGVKVGATIGSMVTGVVGVKVGLGVKLGVGAGPVSSLDTNSASAQPDASIMVRTATAASKDILRRIGNHLVSGLGCRQCLPQISEVAGCSREPVNGDGLHLSVCGDFRNLLPGKQRLAPRCAAQPACYTCGSIA